MLRSNDYKFQPTDIKKDKEKPDSNSKDFEPLRKGVKYNDKTMMNIEV